MAKQIFTVATTALYVESRMNGGGGKQIYEFFFPTKDEDTSSSFSLDKLLQENAYAACYRNSDTQSHLRKYEAGSNTMIKVPRGSEKTPIGEDLIDSVTVGFEATDGVDVQTKGKLSHIVKDHTTAWNMTFNKQSFDLFLTGNLHVRGEEADDIGLDLEYGRAVGNSIPYDFSSGGTFSEAIIEVQNAMLDAGVPRGGQFCFLGDQWASEFSEDTEVKAWLETKPVIPPVPAELIGYEGLHDPQYIKLPGMKTGMWICFYSPGIPYRSKEGGATSEWIPTDDAIFGSWLDVRYDVNRGMDLLGSDGTAQRVVGDIAFDSFTLPDPVGTFARSGARKAFVPAAVNHTFTSKGTFAA